MFEAAELGRKTSKQDYKKQEPVLRVGLLTVQYELRDSDFPVILVLGGDDQPGCTEVSNILHEWMDPRFLAANVYEDLTQEEAERPRFWRYWRTLPTRGRIGLYLREWTTRVIVDRVVGDIDEVGLDRCVRHIQSFEKALTDDGALILKFWLHTPKKELKKRLKRAEKKPGRARLASRQRGSHSPQTLRRCEGSCRAGSTADEPGCLFMARRREHGR